MKKLILVLNKSDLKADVAADELINRVKSKSSEFNSVVHSDGNLELPRPLTLPVSCTTGQGLSELEKMLSMTIANLLETSESQESRESTLITRDRHRRHLTECLDHLDLFLSNRLAMDVAAEELRLAMMELGKITGIVDVDEILDIIFRDFCIGK